MRRPTPAQTAGPYYSLGLDWWQAHPITHEPPAGAAICVRGQVLDGDGAPVPDALVEIWQANGAGDYPTRSAAAGEGFGRVSVDAEGRYTFLTHKPGPTTPQAAPHIHFTLLARGLMNPLVTRLYFADEAARNHRDPALARVPLARRATLIAALTPTGYCFDIHLQGPLETVFFDV
ncbi:MAG: protocatechuate 3,4-dioxygenase subunit alpha [Gammaproteobacteria bacterium]|nr:protocatechuate 3,4-dioxygenase subunit alpha [Gammaproteobacteria bacterium]